MIVGIDASRALTDAPTGTEVYSRELIRGLLRMDHANCYRLYTREPAAGEYFTSSRNCEIRAIPFPRLWTLVRLSVEMVRHPPDLLFVPAHVLPLLHPPRSVVTIHDLGQVHFPQAHPLAQRLYHNWSAWWSTRSAMHILADSEATRRDIVRFMGVAPDRASVVYSSYDARLYRPIQATGQIEEARARFRIGKDYILTIGTIHPRKNHGRLIDAFAMLGRRDCELVVVGKRGWLVEDIFDRVKDNGLKSRVRFLDYVPARDMAALISGARLMAFPSLHEGFGLPVLEAQACGTPVVCSATSSFPEVAGTAAVFVDPLDVGAICEGMRRVLTDEALREKLKADGLENVKRFSWDASARAVLQVFASM